MDDLSQLPSSAKDAKLLGVKYYYSGPCKRGHVARRLTSRRVCAECNSASTRKGRRENNKKYLEQDKRNREKNSKKRNETVKAWRERKKLDPEWVEERRANKRKQAKRLSHLWRANAALRRASKRNATPKWLTQDQINEMKLIYKKAKLMSEETGEPYHVDHIHPLAGKNFCGLHVPWNLCVISGTDNLSKGNRLPPDVDTW